MTIRVVPAYQLTDSEASAISSLLKEAFDSYPSDQTFFKQIPCFHVLMESGDDLVGHASINHRLVNAGGSVFKIFGISDLCISGKSQRKGLGRKLLKKLIKLGRAANVSFLALITDQDDFYSKNGFEKIERRARWVFIADNKLFGVHERRFDDSLFVKSLTGDKWPEGTIDFLGPLF